MASTAKFRLAGEFQQFKGVGEDMVLTTKSPVVATVRISVDLVVQPDGTRQQAARAESIFETSISDDLAKAIQNTGEGDISFHYFPVIPADLQSEVCSIRDQLGSVTTDTLNLVRWSVGEMGPSDPLANASFAVSLEENHWHGIGPMLLFRMSRSHTHFLDERWAQKLQFQLDRGEREPIAWALLREAWSSHFANPRAALVLGVAALEVGTKDCISRLIPESTWLVDNVPSPPVHKILKDYLPKLLAIRGNLALFAPTRSLLKEVQEAVENRNAFVHRFASSGNYQKAEKALRYLELENTLWMIEDFLNLFDVYTGRPLALSRLQSGTRQEMIDRNEKQSLPEPDYGEDLNNNYAEPGNGSKQSG